MNASLPSHLLDGDPSSGRRIILAHGAGAPMDSVLLQGITQHLVAAGLCVARFEFPYMAARRGPEKTRRPPDRADVLLQTWKTAYEELRGPGRTFIGGHSMGGRMATMVADELDGCAGICAVAYPWHPPGKPGQTRTAHLGKLRMRALFICGEIDEFGSPAEVATYALSPSIRVAWLPAVDHALRSRRGSGRTLAGNIREAAEHVVSFTREP